VYNLAAPRRTENRNKQHRPATSDALALESAAAAVVAVVAATPNLLGILIIDKFNGFDL
jgi:hypothetical protein